MLWKIPGNRIKAAAITLTHLAQEVSDQLAAQRRVDRFSAVGTDDVANVFTFTTTTIPAGYTVDTNASLVFVDGVLKPAAVVAKTDATHITVTLAGVADAGVLTAVVHLKRI